MEKILGLLLTFGIGVLAAIFTCYILGIPLTYANILMAILGGMLGTVIVMKIELYWRKRKKISNT